MGIIDRLRRSRPDLGAPRAFSLAIAGFGVELVPHIPCTAAHLEDGTLVFGAKHGGRNAMIKPGTPPRGELAPRTTSERGIITYSTAQRGSTQLVLGPGVASCDELFAAFTVADRPAGWKIVTHDYSIDWPARFVLRAQGDGYELAFDGSIEKLITLSPCTGDAVRRPLQLDQAFVHAGTPWVMRNYHLPVDAQRSYLVRAQVPRAEIDLLSAADAVARSFRAHS